MTYTQLKAVTPKNCTCANCPQFKDSHDEPNSRGWCLLFHKPARSTQALTQDCLSSLPSETEVEFDYCQYQPGDPVKLIEAHKHHTEWESFTVIGQKYNHNRFRSAQSYLNEPNWYICIASTEQPVPTPFWVAETEICPAEHSEFIDTGEVF